MEDNDNTAGPVGYDIITSAGHTTAGKWGTISPAPYEEHFAPAPGTFRVRFYLEENGEMVKGTRLLFNVYVVDPVGDGEVVFRNMEIIALDEESAIRKTVSHPQCKLDKDLDDYDLIVQNLCDWGSIRPKV